MYVYMPYIYCGELYIYIDAVYTRYQSDDITGYICIVDPWDMNYDRSVYIGIHIYIYICVYVCIYIYINI